MPKIIDDVVAIFGSLMPHDLSLYDSIGIDGSDLLEGGEVPDSWLKIYKDNKTWNDLSFTTNCHCVNTSLYDLLSHECYLSRPNRSVSCGLCEKICHSNAFQSSILNHMARHYDFLKFCCVVCSKVFYNMPFLMQHYLDDHPTANLVTYPCLQCGLYTFTLQQLREHKKRRHDSKVAAEIG